MTAADPVAAAYEVLAARVHGTAGRDVPIAPLTSYQLGGAAAVYLEAETVEDLAALAEALRVSHLPLLVLGRGSNMLVSDRGFPGIAVRLGGGFRWARATGERLEAGGAMPLPALAALAASEHLTGFEFASAIPASLGGAVAMNAGAHHRSMADVVSEATVVDLSDGISRSLPATDLGFAYRTSRLPQPSVVVSAVLDLRRGEPDAIAGAMREAKEWRRATQPIGLPNAGSVFKNPPDEAAGSLVERICGKGASHGKARVSEVHANFIVTEPGATAADVYSLIRRIQREVLDNTGVQLETEVKLVGEFEEAR